MNKYLVLASAVLALATAPASAKNDKPKDNGNGAAGNGNGGGNTGGGQQPSGPRACLLTDVAPVALACSGFFAGNLLNNSNVAEQSAALNAIGLAWTGDFNAVSKIGSLNGGTLVDFSTGSNPVETLYGDTWVGVHFGNGAGLGSNATGFWKINAGIAGLSTFLLNITRGSSGAVLYRTGSMPTDDGGGTGGAVPEPASWVMLIAGFGLVGAARRRQRAVAA